MRSPKTRANVTDQKTPIWSTVFFLLLIANVIWMSWNLSGDRNLRSTVKQLKMAEFQTNGVPGVGIVDTKTGKPLWIEWVYDDGSKDFSCFLDGTNIFDLDVWKGRPLKYYVGFHGPGKSATWWVAQGGNGSFTERIFYDTNGHISKDEVRSNQAWHAIDRQNGTNDIVLNRQRHQLGVDTNGMLTTDALTNAPKFNLTAP